MLYFLIPEKLMRHKKAVLRIRDVYPGSRIRIFPARIQGHKDSGSRIRIKEFKYFLTQKIVSKLSEIWSTMFIPDRDRDFLPTPDPGVKKATGFRIPDPGSATPIRDWLLPAKYGSDRIQQHLESAYN